MAYVGQALLLLVLASTLQAEPWIANRYAQNCAGCHAPGRKNLPAPQRRCTLSCQGCHVNPNGGGMRNHYGKWNENRWLRSFSMATKEWSSPTPYQTTEKSTPIAKKSDIKKPEFKKAEEKKKLHLLSKYVEDETLYDRRNGLEQIIASEAEFLQQIPTSDPYYLRDQNRLDGGADLRWQNIYGNSTYSDKSGVSKTKIWQSFLMNVDLALRWRPLYRNLNFIYEGRYLGNPSSKRTEDVAATLNRRSLYVLVDDLPFNSYAMAGYYRPLFGHYTPDHTSVAQQMLSAALQGNANSYDLGYQAYTIGGSPNVPYLNLHYISRRFGSNSNDRHQAVAFNLGGRFVTFGLSPHYSFWSGHEKVNNQSGSSTVKLQMHALGVGAQVLNTTINVETAYFLKDVPNDSFVKANNFSLELYTKVVRENYVFSSFAVANTALDLKPGKTQQLRIGWRSFLTAGCDIFIFTSIDAEERIGAINREPSDSKAKTLNGQLHLSI